MFDSPLNTELLEERAYRVRQHILRMSTGGGCFTGASLSCADLLCYLYTSFLNISPKNLDDAQRDYLFLSKGHDVPALYGVLAECGFFPRERLHNHLAVTDSMYWHPNTAIPGIEFHSGSLGHVLSVAMGVALDCLKKGTGNSVVVVAGDGELNEGSMWEAMLVASALSINNLILVIDRNHFQANIRTEELIPL
ncbi:MAG: transketolase, partial [Candidatus Kapabacteria bacterium]|nr:transketolase [Candidatus Kapabacteria bacterium]